MTAIIDVHGRQILDSRGNPTVEVEVMLEDGSFGRAAVPSGASTGAHEAVELRDGDKSRWGGKGVSKAVAGGQRRDRRRGRRPGGRGPGRDRRGDDRTRRHREQGPARRQRDPRASASRRRRRRRTRVGLPLYRYVGGVDAHLAAGADDEHPQRRRARRQQIDFQEFMVMPVGAPTLRRGAALGRRDLPRAQERPARGRARDRGRRRGRLRAGSTRRARRSISSKGDRARPATSPARTCCSRSIRRRASSSRTALRAEGRGQEPDAGGDGRLLRRRSLPTIRSPRSRTAWPRTTGRAGRR